MPGLFIATREGKTKVIKSHKDMSLARKKLILVQLSLNH